MNNDLPFKKTCQLVPLEATANQGGYRTASKTTDQESPLHSRGGWNAAYKTTEHDLSLINILRIRRSTTDYDATHFRREQHELTLKRSKIYRGFAPEAFEHGEDGLHSSGGR